MQSWDTWDIFALSFLYLSFLQKLCIDCFKDYQSFLVQYILAFPIKIEEDKPNERIDIAEYYNQLVFFSEKYSDLNRFNFDKDEYSKKSKMDKLLIYDLEKKITQQDI